MVPFQVGDMESTYADTQFLNDTIYFQPKTKLDDGIKLFCEWYKSYFNY